MSAAADDTTSSDERNRYRELLEELRTVLPGVQVLFGFLLVAPFSQRFTELDDIGRMLYGLALMGTAVAAIVFLAPASYHRVAPRRLRRDRLRTAIRLTVGGMLVLGVSVVAAVLAVMRFVFDDGVAAISAVGLAALLGVLWYLAPLVRRVRGDGGRRRAMAPEDPST